MKNDITELVFILDRSGSMSGLERDTIGGFNAMLKTQAEEPGQALVNTVLFNSDSVVIHDRVPLDKVEPMTGRQYRVGGCTALLDAVGGAIRHIGNVHKYAREEDRPGKTLFIITTDGMENASRNYSYGRVKSMIEHQKEIYGWEFLFLGANMDAISAAGRFGIRAERAVRYAPDSAGTALNFSVVSDTVAHFRASRQIDENWAAPIAADYRKRGK